MFVITADQVDSRRSEDRVAREITELNRSFTGRLVQKAERTVGDELQLLTDSSTTALEVLLALTRSDEWSVGIGVGAVQSPLGATVRESRGPAFVAARDAVERAKRRQTRFALAAEGDAAAAADLEALVDLLLLLRARRTGKGWELYDRLRSGATQAEAAEAAGVTPQAASKTARAAGLRVEVAAEAALARLLGKLGENSGARE